MTNDQYLQMLANGSKSLREVNPQDTGSPAIVERDSGDAPLGKGKAKDSDSGRVLVRVTSIRKRLIDVDNLAEKFAVDCCRYAGLIHDDAPDQTEIQVTQRKAAKGEEEHTLIEIFDLPNNP